jgi:hypothetical protein
MKNLYLLVFTFLMFGGLHGQKNKSNYDSKWFIGFNTGITWSSSDVDNSFAIREAFEGRSTSPTGWSIFLGKSYNYDYGKLLSFDLRGRYLHGHWYGQNSELDSSMTSINDDAQDIYDLYNTQYGGFIPNYYTDLRRLSLELVIHLNKIREKTGFDPYIFGGLGFSWKTIKADLTSLNEFNEAELYSETEMLNNDLDFDFETDLIRKQKLFMPSLGFGLAYDFGKTSIGLEHKTTFTRGDQFDGYVSETPMLENDLYHYTSAFIRFRLGGSGNTSRPPRPNPKPPTSSNNSSSGFTSCPSPVVNILNTNNTSSSQGTMTIEAQLTNVSSVGDIKLTDMNQMPLPFDYDSFTNKVTATVTLAPGNNTFFINAKTSCGSDMARLNVQNTTSSSSGFTSCPSPIVNILTSNNNSISDGTMSISAQIENVNNASAIKLTNANQVQLAFNFDVNTKMLSATVNLVEGNNLFFISATNSCGGDSEQITVQHTNISCPSPEVNVINSNNSSASQGVITISALIENVNNISEIKLTNTNQVVLPFNYDFNSKTLTASVPLSEGTNTFYISAINNCGGDTDQINITFTNTPCQAPVVNVLNANNAQVNEGVLIVNAQVLNVSSASEIVFTNINQLSVPFNFDMNSKTLTASVALTEGNNTFFITASNSCGSDTDRLNVEYSNCSAPSGTFVNPLSTATVASSSLLIQANILGITDAGLIRLFVNNNQLFGFNFNPSTGLLQGNLSLTPGQNNIQIDFANDCGQGSISSTIIYESCEPPVIELIHPTASGATTNIQNQNIDIQITGTDVSKNNIQIKVNGKLMNISAASYVNDLLSFSVVLAPGINTISVDIQNGCGTDSEVFTIDFENCTAPSIVFNGIQSGLVTTQSSLGLNLTINEIFGAQNITYKLNGNSMQGLIFNAQNKTLYGNIALIPGDNYFNVSATNDCGTAVETLHIIYNDCKDPTITITSLGSLSGGTNVSVTNPSYSLVAQLSNVIQSQYISVKQNGQNLNYSFMQGNLLSNLTLNPGLNTITVSVNSPCGSASANLTVVYDDCQAPNISLKLPASSSHESTSQKVQVIAKLTNVTNKGQITVLNGGTSIPFAFNNGIVKTQVMLSDGQNNIIIRVKNPCGENTENISISYVPCLTPQIVMNPSTPSVVMTAQVQLNAFIQNYAANTNITITVNGHAIAPSNFQINNGNLSGLIPLNNGSNTISVYAVSPCGSDAKEFSILRCKNPSVNWINPALVNTVVTNGTFTLQVLANNAFTASSITLKLNGSPISFNYNSNTDELTTTVNLAPGNNTFSIKIANTCGIANSDIKVIYQTGNNGSNGNNGMNGSNGNNGTNGSNGNNGMNGSNGSNGMNGSNGNNGMNGSNGNNGTNGSNGNNGMNGSNGTNGSNGNNNSGNSNSNNGHGNNTDGVDVSNPGQGGGGPNGQNDPSGNTDDENQGNGSSNMGTNGNKAGQNNKSITPTTSTQKNKGGSNTKKPTPKPSNIKSNKPNNSSNSKEVPNPKTPSKTAGKGKGR